MQAKRMYRRGVTTAEEAIAGRYTEQDHGHATPCWIWVARYASPTQRPKVYFKGKMVIAYRLAYEGLVGPIGEGMVLDHLCRQPTCVNPAHLEPVTDRENRRRAKQVKLSDEDVREVRRLLAEGNLYQREIGDLFGVCDATISLINTRTNWAGFE